MQEGPKGRLVTLLSLLNVAAAVDESRRAYVLFQRDLSAVKQRSRGNVQSGVGVGAGGGGTKGDDSCISPLHTPPPLEESLPVGNRLQTAG